MFLPHILGKFSFPSFLLPSLFGHLSPFPFHFFTTFLGSLCSGVFTVVVARLCGSGSSQLSTKMYICTSEPFDVISLVWWGPSLVVLSALTGTACTIYCRLAINSFSLPMWGDFSLGYSEGRELAFLQLSSFFNFSPSEVVLMKYKKYFQEIKLLRNENCKKFTHVPATPLDQIYPISSSVLFKVYIFVRRCNHRCK